MTALQSYLRNALLELNIGAPGLFDVCVFSAGVRKVIFSSGRGRVSLGGIRGERWPHEIVPGEVSGR